MIRERPSLVPLASALGGLVLVVGGAFLPWVYLYGHRAQNGLTGGWIIAHARGHFSDHADGAYPVAWQFGADAWIVVALALLAVGVAVYNRRAREQQYDKLQFALGVLIIAVVAYNAFFVLAHADEHLVHSDPGGDRVDRLGAGMLMTLAGGALAAIGAVLGNTPEFDFADEPVEEGVIG